MEFFKGQGFVVSDLSRADHPMMASIIRAKSQTPRFSGNFIVSF